MIALRRLGYATLGVAFFHIVFGAIVRITGSGMGCGDHWPRCFNPDTGMLHWFPPFSRPDLIIEVLHRYFAAALTTTVLGFLALAVAKRREPGVGGRGGVLRAAALAAGLVVSAALFGAVTVFAGNPPWATIVHKAIAAALVAALAAAVLRAGGLGGARVRLAAPTPKTFRGARVGAALALAAVLLGGATAKVVGAAAACRGFPFCGEGSLGGGPQHVQLTHRIVAYLVALHLVGLFVAARRRGERGPVMTAAAAAVGVVGLQIALGAAMVLGGFPPVLRSLHQATGVALWLVTFVLAYLARQAGRGPLAPVVGGDALALGTPTLAAAGR